MIAARTGASYLPSEAGGGELTCAFLGKICRFSWPELLGWDSQGSVLPDMQQALLLYYLVTADGASPTGTWVSFAELPDGRFYDAAFQGYSGEKIVAAFEQVDPEGTLPRLTDKVLLEFERVCLSSGGKPIAQGSCAFTFDALPRVPLLVIYWLGDEDFPSSAKILFDESVCHYLPIDACAILGSMLAAKLVSLSRIDSQVG